MKTYLIYLLSGKEPLRVHGAVLSVDEGGVMLIRNEQGNTVAVFRAWAAWLLEEAAEDLDAAAAENATLSNVLEVARKHGYKRQTFLSCWLDDELGKK